MSDERTCSGTMDHHDREFLGRLVRMVWVKWAREQDSPKPHWLDPWEELDEPMREVYRRIGERISAVTGALARREIERLEDENSVLRSRLTAIESGR